ncbi:hypothetical protein CDAR_464361 [Caerostris darwini]|uniref:Uncharacterized protein n=1 Tax=Caerostris darwini TaxID=1538125 RepID=A0AAV4VW98_9ARAC|nr:hypothetical protein CDAR_464361 [Caerostris darwini]
MGDVSRAGVTLIIVLFYLTPSLPPFPYDLMMHSLIESANDAAYGGVCVKGLARGGVHAHCRRLASLNVVVEAVWDCSTGEKIKHSSRMVNGGTLLSELLAEGARGLMRWARCVGRSFVTGQL